MFSTLDISYINTIKIMKVNFDKSINDKFSYENDIKSQIICKASLNITN